MQKLFTGVSALSLIMAQAAPVLAQEAAPPPMDRMARPAPQPAVQPAPAPARPSTKPAKPGFGGSGGSQGGNNGGSWQGGNRPPPPNPNNGWGGSGGSWENSNNNNWNNNNNNNWNNNGGNWSGATVRCESKDGRYRTCNADTRGGVRLVRTLSSTPCRQGSTWGSNPGQIWVNNGCRGEFQLRYGGGGGGGGNWDNNQDDGPSTGAVIGGVAVAAGLIALLASGSKKGSDTKAAANAVPPPGAPAPPAPGQPAPPAYVPPAGSTGQPARINVPIGSVPAAADPSFRSCITEAARQIGATGGTEIQLDRIIETEAGNGGYRFRMNLKGVYPDETRLIPTYCRATPTQVVELTFG